MKLENNGFLARLKTSNEVKLKQNKSKLIMKGSAKINAVF